MNPYIDNIILFCKTKLVEADPQYRFIHEYIYFRSLEEAVKLNRENLAREISSIDEINVNTDLAGIFKIKYRIQNSILNVLNSHKALIDLIDRGYKTEANKYYDKLSKVKSYYYDNDFNYRLFESLRNYCQHARAVPIEIYSDLEGRSYLMLDKEELKKDKTIYKKLRAEIDSNFPIEIRSVARDWVKPIDHIYGLILDYFAYMSKSSIESYKHEVFGEFIASDLSGAQKELLKKYPILLVKKRMHFPVALDSNALCDEMHERLKGRQCRDRFVRASRMISSLKRDIISDSRLEALGLDVGKLRLDTLTVKNINKWLNDEDQF